MTLFSMVFRRLSSEALLIWIVMVPWTFVKLLFSPPYFSHCACRRRNFRHLESERQIVLQMFSPDQCNCRIWMSFTLTDVSVMVLKGNKLRLNIFCRRKCLPRRAKCLSGNPALVTHAATLIAEILKSQSIV